MEFEEMGNPAGKTLMLLPGTGCTWQMNFRNVTEELEQEHLHHYKMMQKKEKTA